MAATLDEEYVNVPEAAERLGVSASTVWRWIDRGRLPAYRVGPRNVRLKVVDVTACVTPARPRTPHHMGVILSNEADVRRPMSEEERAQMRDALRLADEAREALRIRLAGQELPPAYVVINESRDARTRQLMGEE